MPKKILQQIMEAPAVSLEKAMEESKKLTHQLTSQKSVQQAKKFWHSLGPGLTTGAADDDPSGIGTYSQAGARYGFQLLWLSLFTFPFMAVVQEMCARIGMVTGRGLAANIRLHYSKWVLYLVTCLLIIANTFNIGADLGAMAKATQLLAPDISFVVLVSVFAVVSIFLQVFIPYKKYAQYLKWLALILISYIISAILIKPNWLNIFTATIIPSIVWSKEQIILICAILGTTISPYLFFWQTSQEVEEEILAGKRTIQARKDCTPKEIRSMRIDVWSGMFFSNFVMFFIIAACAATLFATGIGAINTASDAAEALRPIAGDSAYLLFTIGIIGTGLLAVPVLAGASSYAVSESLKWKTGLYRKLKEAYAFYGILIISVLVGIGLNFIGLDPIKALIYSAVANGVVAPVVLVLIVRMSSNKKIMGDKSNHPFLTMLGWVITVLMVVAGGAALWALFL